MDNKSDKGKDVFEAIEQDETLKKTIKDFPVAKKPKTEEETSFFKKCLEEAKNFLLECGLDAEDERTALFVANLIIEYDDTKIWLDLSENRRDAILAFLAKQCLPAEISAEKRLELMEVMWKAAIIGASIPQAINSADIDYEENEDEED